MKNSPLVSIIMATYNRATLIEQVLETIMGQTFKDWECIIVDDGSADNTEQVVSDSVANDPRFIYLQRTAEYKKGLPGSRNMGLNIAQGKYIIFFDDDDIVHPQNLEICISVLTKEAGYFCRYDKRPFSTVEAVNTFEKIKEVVPVSFETQDIDKMIMGEVPFASCSVMWRKECFEDIRFNEELMYAEEWECYCRILAAGFTGSSIKEILYFNRKHSESNTGEFYSKDLIRRKSYVTAIKLVLDRLAKKHLLSSKLEIFFIRLGFFLKDYSVIKYTLLRTESNKLKRFKYLSGYFFYPLLRPLFIAKKKLKNYLN